MASKLTLQKRLAASIMKVGKSKVWLNPEKEKMKVLRETPEFKEMDREVKEYAKKMEDLLKRARAGEDFAKLAKEYSMTAASTGMVSNYQLAGTNLGKSELRLTGEAGREIEGPMAIVILGGLITSTTLNLLVLPTLALRYGRFAGRTAIKA